MLLSDKKRVEYYNDYFNEFYSFLEENNLDEDSLIIIASDHGPKGGQPRSSSDFNIPLMVIANNSEYSEIDHYYSHFSFKDILFHYYIGTNLPNEEKLIYLIGQTARNRVGYIDPINNYFVLGQINSESILLSPGNLNFESSDVQNRIGNLLEYQRYVKKISLEAK